MQVVLLIVLPFAVGIASSVVATYLVRLLDKITRKNDRQDSQSSGH